MSCKNLHAFLTYQQKLQRLLFMFTRYVLSFFRILTFNYSETGVQLTGGQGGHDQPTF